MRLLHIDSSITGGDSASRQVTGRIVGSIREAHPGIEVIRRDLEAEPLPHLNSKMLAGLAPTISEDGAAADAETRAELGRGFQALEEFLKADIVVIGAPMYNFSISSQLKAWIDRIMVAGKTFAYTAEGPKGLAGGKRVIIASSRGGVYARGSAQAVMDFQETYLGAIFRFIGVTDVTFIRAEGMAVSPEQRATALTKALETAALLPMSQAAAKAA
ncbi:MAG TPA: FMN-dependent NADH-azoreductase [Rhizomicrobium sp.]|nr:FMN-dependent NADH-azoreductase [Rhizomicrobium sp.]